MKTILALAALVTLAGCGSMDTAERFQIVEPVQVKAVMERTGQAVNLLLPRGCVVSVDAEEMRAELQASR